MLDCAVGFNALMYPRQYPGQFQRLETVKER